MIILIKWKVLNIFLYLYLFMSIQINIELSDKTFNIAKEYATNYGFDTLQDFIKETLRKKLFEKEEELNGKLTYLASEKSLAKNWLSKEEDKAWAHLQKEK